MIREPNHVLGKCRVFFRVGMAHCRAKILNIIVRDLMSVSAERGQFQAANHWLKGKWIHTNGIKNELASKIRREEVIDFCDQCVTAKLPRMPRAFAADGFGKVTPIFVSFARQNGRAAKSVKDARKASQWSGGVGLRPLQVA